MAWGTGQYRVRRLGPKKFRVVNPAGDYVANQKGNMSQYASHEAALAACKALESGTRREQHPLIEDE